MENEAMIIKDTKTAECSPRGSDVVSPTSKMMSAGGISGQGSVTKHNCLCAPTTHAGSFRCRLHRSPSLQRTKSIDPPACQDSQSKA
ncbi:hypothetical protein F511_40309 [Dorcoceras hygrometricum]|uniref:Uncharacterized protein n=1 Tax=Dorcoceras hygrometricum TaxID=472368 RepID=A0A2Z7A0E1_9LAMI|nr:hypothetical protein F511_40309 [Dorcoceras hygrometricum]